MLRTPPRSTNQRAAKKSRTTTTVSKPSRYPLYAPVRVSTGRQAFPPQLKNKLTYATWASVTCSLGAYSQYIFSCNGLYDPDFTATGHQPLYFDQLMTIYNHYTVTASTISVSILAPPGAEMGCVLFKDDDATSGVTETAQAIERAGCVYMAVETTNLPGTNVLRNRWTSKSVFPGDPLSRDELQGDATKNPAEQTFFIIGVENRLLETTQYRFVVKIEYEAVFDELKSIAQS